MKKALTKLSSWLKRQEKIQTTRRELSALNDRELSDIGLSRADIDRVARGEVRSWTII